MNSNDSPFDENVPMPKWLQQMWIDMYWLLLKWLNQYIKYKCIVNVNKFKPQRLFPFFDRLCPLCILTLRLYFMHLFNDNQHITIQICCGLFYILLKTCFTIEDSNLDLPLSLSCHVKCLLISEISRLWHVTTERKYDDWRWIWWPFCTHKDSF